MANNTRSTAQRDNKKDKKDKTSNSDIMSVVLNIQNSIDNQKKMLKKLNKKVTLFSDEIKQLKAENEELKSAIDKLHFDQNKNIVMISGVPIQDDEDQLGDVIEKGLNGVVELGECISEVRRVYKLRKPTKQVEITFNKHYQKQQIMKKFIDNAKNKNPYMANIFNGSASDKIYFNNILPYTKNR